MGQVRTLGTVRHECLRCGGSCQGAIVVLQPQERDAIRALGASLGLHDVVVGDRLRQVDGRCAILDDAGACRIHATFGSAAKPQVCRQYPVVAVRAEDELRVGIDPGCYTHVRTWRTGPEVAEDSLAVARVELPPHERVAERALLGLLGADGQTLEGALGALIGRTDGLPGRLVRWVRDAQLDRHVAHRETPAMLKLTVGRVVSAAQGWDPEAPPAWPRLSSDAEAFALDAARRTLFLRLYRELPAAGAALLALTGGVLVGWATEGAPDQFGPTLAGWMRAIRSQSVLYALVPEPTRLRWLATGA